MEFLNNTSLIIVSYFGIIAGFIISNFTKEELSFGKKYFRRLRHVFFALILSLYMYNYLKPIFILSISCLIIGIFHYYIDKKMMEIKTDALSYLLFSSIGLITELNIVVLAFILIFMYGLVSSSYYSANNKSDFKDSILDMIKTTLSYPIISIFIFFLI